MRTGPAARARRWPLVLAGAVGLAGLLAIGVPRLSGGTGTPAGAGSAGRPPGGGRAASTTGDSPAASSAAASLPGGYIPEYHGLTFTLPGGNCTDGGSSPVSYIPSDVQFTAHGPQVATGNNIGSGDLALSCFDPYGNNTTDVRLNNTEVAVVAGSPGAQACATTVQQHPLSSNILWPQLSVGVSFCLIGSVNGGQLVRITLLSKSDSTYDLTWSATAWSMTPAG